jgi:hypothetical protein
MIDHGRTDGALPTDTHPCLPTQAAGGGAGAEDGFYYPPCPRTHPDEEGWIPPRLVQCEFKVCVCGVCVYAVVCLCAYVWVRVCECLCARSGEQCAVTSPCVCFHMHATTPLINQQPHVPQRQTDPSVPLSQGRLVVRVISVCVCVCVWVRVGACNKCVCVCVRACVRACVYASKCYYGRRQREREDTLKPHVIHHTRT